MSLKEIFNNIINYEMDGTIILVIFAVVVGGWAVIKILGGIIVISSWFMKQVRDFKEAMKD